MASCRNLSCSPYKLKIGNLSGLKMPVVQSRWVVNCACGGGWREAAWCHGCLLYPRLVCSCWLFSSTEQHDTIHFHIQIKVEHFKAIFTLFVCFWKKDLFFSLFFVCWVCVCEWIRYMLQGTRLYIAQSIIPFLQLHSHSSRKRVNFLQPHDRPGFSLSL